MHMAGRRVHTRVGPGRSKPKNQSERPAGGENRLRHLVLTGGGHAEWAYYREGPPNPDSVPPTVFCQRGIDREWTCFTNLHSAGGTSTFSRGPFGTCMVLNGTAITSSMSDTCVPQTDNRL